MGKTADLGLNTKEIGVAYSSQLGGENENWIKIDAELGSVKAKVEKSGTIEPVLLIGGEQQRFNVAENSYHRFVVSVNKPESAMDIIVIRLGANPYVLTTVKSSPDITIQKNADGSAIFLTSTMTGRGYRIFCQG